MKAQILVTLDDGNIIKAEADGNEPLQVLEETSRKVAYRITHPIEPITAVYVAHYLKHSAKIFAERTNEFMKQLPEEQDKARMMLCDARMFLTISSSMFSSVEKELE